MTVSVLIPTYNRAHLLPRCLESILDQTYHDLEIIVYDDGSTDNTDSVLRSFGDKRIGWRRSTKNGGDAKSRNMLLKLSTCKYAIWQDSDDFSNKYRVEMMLETIQHFNVPMCRCYGQRHTEYKADSWKDKPTFRVGGNRTEAAIMFDVEKARQVPYDERIWLGSDIVWELAMVVKHGPGLTLPYMLYNVDIDQPDRMCLNWKHQMERYTEGVKIKRAEIKRLMGELRKRKYPRWPPRVPDAWAKELYERVCGA